jgi:hypothetical protein
MELTMKRKRDDGKTNDDKSVVDADETWCEYPEKRKLKNEF